MKKSGIPISITMCIGPLGDFNDVPVEEVGIRLAKAGRSYPSSQNTLYFEPRVNHSKISPTPYLKNQKIKKNQKKSIEIKRSQRK